MVGMALKKRCHYEVDFLKSLRNSPHSLRKPALDPNLDIVCDLEDKVNVFEQLLASSNDSTFYEDMHHDEIVIILVDYVNSKNVLPTTNLVKLIEETPKMKKFVAIALCMLLKNGYSDKLIVPIAIGELFAQLIAQRILIYSTLYSGFDKFLMQRNSFESKYKHFMDTVTEFLTSLLMSLSQYHQKYIMCGMLKIFKNKGEAQELMAKVIKRLSELNSPESAKSLWASAGFQWSDFLQPGSNEREFLKVHGLLYSSPHTFPKIHEIEELFMRQKDCNNDKPELKMYQSVDDSIKWSFARLSGIFVDELDLVRKTERKLDMASKFTDLLREYLDDHDLERFRLQVEPFLKRKNTADDFVRCAIQSGIEFGIQFRKPIGQLLSYLIAFGLVTEEQRLEGLKVVPQLLHIRKANIDEKDAIKKVISSFMVNSEVKASALWKCQKIKLSNISNVGEIEFE